jgi:hypothetical protein
MLFCLLVVWQCCSLACSAIKFRTNSLWPFQGKYHHPVDSLASFLRSLPNPQDRELHWPWLCHWLFVCGLAHGYQSGRCHTASLLWSEYGGWGGETGMHTMVKLFIWTLWKSEKSVIKIWEICKYHGWIVNLVPSLCFHFPEYNPLG